MAKKSTRTNIPASRAAMNKLAPGNNPTAKAGRDKINTNMPVPESEGNSNQKVEDYKAHFNDELGMHDVGTEARIAAMEKATPELTQEQIDRNALLANEDEAQLEHRRVREEADIARDKAFAKELLERNKASLVDFKAKLELDEARLARDTEGVEGSREALAQMEQDIADAEAELAGEEVDEDDEEVDAEDDENIK